MHINTHQMMDLFSGDTTAYGIYRVNKENVRTEEGKLLGKAATLKKPVTIELWDGHLFGKEGIGIIPINSESKVKFGAIDIDDYTTTPEAINMLVRRHELPLVTCRTKSGGTHLYLFMNEFCTAKMVQAKLREFAAILGYGTAEIFPKQTEILSERGDIGQWINMPYFDEQKTTRFALHEVTNRALSLEEFIKYANSKRMAAKDLYNFSVKYTERLPGAPPCLQLLAEQGFPPGTRNNGLFNLGVYCMKAYPDEWETKLDELNAALMMPPLSSTEVKGVAKSLKKKGYEYTCKAEPIHAFCNSVKCRTCKYGINTGSGLPAMGTLTKLDTDPPIWFIDIADGGRLELNTDELQNPLRFQKKCMESLNMMPPVLKRDAWQLIIQQLLETCSVVTVPRDSSTRGEFTDYLEEFCCGRVQAKTHEDILVGKPLQIGDFHYFRLKDLMEYFERKKLKYARNRVTMLLKDIGAETYFKNISGKGCNLWKIPAFKRAENELSIPELDGEGVDETL